MIERGAKQKWSVAVSGRVIQRGMSMEQAVAKIEKLEGCVPNIVMFQESDKLGDIA